MLLQVFDRLWPRKKQQLQHLRSCFLRLAPSKLECWYLQSPREQIGHLGCSGSRALAAFAYHGTPLWTADCPHPTIGWCCHSLRTQTLDLSEKNVTATPRQKQKKQQADGSCQGSIGRIVHIQHCHDMVPMSVGRSRQLPHVEGIQALADELSVKIMLR